MANLTMIECSDCINKDKNSSLCGECRYHSHKKVYIAVKAAQNVKNWGYFAAVRFCKKRGVEENVLEAAIYCEAMQAVDEGRKDYKGVPIFLQAQAF